MESKTSRAAAVRHALARRARTVYTTAELQLLTQYVLGSRSLEQVNAQLRLLGLTLSLAQPSQPVV